MLRVEVKELRTVLESYVVVYNDEHDVYMAINKKDIDENGKLTKVYNGVTGNACKDARNCIQQTLDGDEFRKLINEGVDKREALKRVYIDKRD